MGLKGIVTPPAMESERRSKPYETEYLRWNFSVRKVYEEIDSIIKYNFQSWQDDMNKYRKSPFPSYAHVGWTRATSMVHKKHDICFCPLKESPLFEA